MSHVVNAPITRRRLVAIALAAGAVLAARPIASRAQSGDALTFVAAGLDSRGPGDTNILFLVRVDMAAATVRALSIPPALYVLIPRFGPDKISRAYTFGMEADREGAWEAGAKTLSDTILRNFDIEIDGSAVIDFHGFPKLVDALGGITVDNPSDLYNLDRSQIDFPAGRIALNGEEALEFALTHDQDGDEGRVHRQRLVIAAMLDKAQDPAIRDDLPTIATTASDTIRTDVSLREQFRILSLVRDVSAEDVAFGTITELLTGETLPSEMWVYQADWETLPGYVQPWLDGDV